MYIELKGDNSQIGALTTIQKIAHEFKHGEQFLNGEFGFYHQDGKWTAIANDVYDESEAMIAGFEAEPMNGMQLSEKNKNHRFMRNLNTALPDGIEAVRTAMLIPGSPYSDYSKVKVTPDAKNPYTYAIPKK